VEDVGVIAKEGKTQQSKAKQNKIIKKKQL
jgi:hypothetical protein